MSRDEQERLRDIRDAIVAIREHLDQTGKTAAATENPLLHDALLFQFVVIGEAVKHLAPDTRESAPEIPWTDVAGLRDLIAHEYFRIPGTIAKPIPAWRLTPVTTTIHSSELQSTMDNFYSELMTDATYDRIGVGYSDHRRADPRIAARITAALGDARTVVNVGAGTGSYEPRDREVTAVEPSAEMIAQRPTGAAPVVQANAESLPFDDDSFDAALAVLTAHHWTDLSAGLNEMQRVARRRIVMVTFDSEALENLWITANYFPKMLTLQRPSGASSRNLVTALPTATSSALPVPRDCSDHFFAALWARPELLFDDDIVRPMWVWQSISEEARQTGRERLSTDLENGTWEERYGHLRHEPELDVGLRLIVAEMPI